MDTDNSTTTNNKNHEPYVFVVVTITTNCWGPNTLKCHTRFLKQLEISRTRNVQLDDTLHFPHCAIELEFFHGLSYYFSSIFYVLKDPIFNCCTLFFLPFQSHLFTWAIWRKTNFIIIGQPSLLQNLEGSLETQLRPLEVQHSKVVYGLNPILFNILHDLLHTTIQSLS